MDERNEDVRTSPSPTTPGPGRLRSATRFGGRAIASIGDQACAAAANFLTSVFIGRMLGSEALGVYAMTDVIVRVLRGISLSALMEPMAIYAPRRSAGEIGSYLGFLVISEVVVIGSLTVLLALGSLVWNVSGGIDTPTFYVVLAALVYTNLILLQLLIRRQFYIDRQPFKALMQSASNLLLVAAGFVGFYYLGGATLISIYAMLTAAGVLVCLVQAWRLLRGIRRPSRDEFKTYTRETWHYARWSVLSVPIFQASTSGVIVLGGLMLPIEAVGYLKAADTVLAPFLQIIIGLNLMMLPAISKQIDSMSRRRKKHRVFMQSMATLAIAAVYSAAMFFLGPWMIHSAFGPDLGPAVDLVRIFALIPLFDAMSNAPSVFLAAEGRSDLKLIANCARAAMTVLAGIPLIWFLGASGGAWARVASSVIGMAVSWGCIYWIWRVRTGTGTGT